MSESILRLPEVQARTGLSRSTIYERLKDHLFPKPISLGVRAIGFVESEIEAWIQSRITESRVDSSS
jgi:prophage regulatory protein